VSKDNLFFHHRMTLYNHDLFIEYQLENDAVKIIGISFMKYEHPDLLKFLSGKVHKIIIDEIEDLEKNKT
jgi:hypothetical protein